MPNLNHNLIEMKGINDLDIFVTEPDEFGNMAEFVSFPKIVPIPEEYDVERYSTGSPAHKWRRENWGCPSWGFRPIKVGNDILMFDTAWGVADGIVEALSQQYPENPIFHVYQLEDGYEVFVSQYREGKEVAIPKALEESSLKRYESIMRDGGKWYEMRIVELIRELKEIVLKPSENKDSDGRSIKEGRIDEYLLWDLIGYLEDVYAFENIY